MQLCNERQNTESASPLLLQEEVCTQGALRTLRGKDGDLLKGPFVRHKQNSDVDFHCNELLSI